MRWEERLLDLFDDLEQQAEGLHLAERDAELVDRSRAEYSHVTLAARLHASLGAPVNLDVLGVGAVHGDLVRVGLDWCLVRSTPATGEWIVRFSALKKARGLSERAVNQEARSVLARLTFGAVLRGVAESTYPAVIHHVDGSQTRARLARVGADFVESWAASQEEGPGRARRAVAEVTPFSSIAAVRPA
ncbi:MAG: hypothetical protein ACRDPJ_13845 [Nocardioidaceae bacterium]